MSDTTSTAQTLYREGDKVRYTFTPSPSEEGRTHEGILTRSGEGVYLRDDEHGLMVVANRGGTAGGISDVEMLERYGLPVKQIARADHPELFAERFRDEVTHALVFTSTSTEGGEVLTVPYAPSAEAGWQIGAGDLFVCGLPADHALLGEWGWLVNKDALREVGVKFPEDLPEPGSEEPKSEADLELERLRAEVERLTDDNRRLVQADQDLRREVGIVAMRYAREHGWCGVVKEALGEAGIDVPAQQYDIDLVIRVRVRASCDLIDLPSLDWTRDSIYLDTGSLTEAINFDGDWRDVEMVDEQFEVEGVEPIDPDFWN